MALPTVTTTLKGLAAITLASLLTLGASSPAFADDSPIPDDATEYGSVTVKYSPAGGSGIRPAWITGSHTTKVAGGTWSYGTNSKVVYSNFHHPSRCHGSILSPNLQWAHHRTKFQNCRREVVLRSGPTLH